MIEMYHRIAHRLEVLGPVLWAWFGLALLFALYVLFADQSLVPAEAELGVVVLPIWCLSMIAMRRYFLAITPRPDRSMGFFRRMLAHSRRLFSWLVALVFTAITLLVFYLSYRAVLMVLN